MNARFADLRRRSLSTSRRAGRFRRALRRTVVVLAILLVTVTSAAAGYDRLSSGGLPPSPLDRNGHMVAAGGVVTHYEQWGTTGSPVVLVHGFVESSWVWREVGPLLAARGHRVFALDVRGYGYTQRRGPYTLASDVQQLLAFVTALQLDAAHGALPELVGHSSGAAIVGDLARLHPAAVRSVVLMDGDGTPYGVGPGWVHRLFVDPYATALIRLATRHPSLAARAYRGACTSACPLFDADAWLRPFRVRGAEQALKQVLAQPLIGMTYAEEEQIAVPAAVVYGTADPEMTAAQAAATAARLHTATVVALPGAPHLGMLAQPAATAAALNRA